MSLRILLGNQVENLWHLQLEPGLPLRTVKSTELKYSKYIICFIWNRAIITGFPPPPTLENTIFLLWLLSTGNAGKMYTWVKKKNKIDDFRKQSRINHFRAYLFPCLYVSVLLAYRMENSFYHQPTLKCKKCIFPGLWVLY